LKIPKGLTQHENPDKFRVIFRRVHELFTNLVLCGLRSKAYEETCVVLGTVKATNNALATRLRHAAWWWMVQQRIENLCRVAPIALTLRHFVFRLLPPVDCKRTANAYLFFELTLGIPTDVSL
jgi:hypothetical protein